MTLMGTDFQYGLILDKIFSGEALSEGGGVIEDLRRALKMAQDKSCTCKHEGMK